MGDTGIPQTNRRAATRRKPRGRITLECRRGVMGLGPNLAVKLLDVSQIGARLVLREEMKIGEEVEILLGGSGPGKPTKLSALVARLEPAIANEGFTVGVRFRRFLSYPELQSLT